jgi:hypothetical protein
MTVRVLIATPIRLYREGLALTLNVDGVAVVGTAGSGAETLA